jgi:hypothetical protein
MTEMHFNGFGVATSKPNSSECCDADHGTYIDLEHATLLKGEPGFEEITDEVVQYLDERSVVATFCKFTETGECALKAAGMLNSYPANTANKQEVEIQE